MREPLFTRQEFYLNLLIELKCLRHRAVKSSSSVNSTDIRRLSLPIGPDLAVSSSLRQPGADKLCFIRKPVKGFPGRRPQRKEQQVQARIRQGQDAEFRLN